MSDRALAYLESRTQLGIKFGLDTIRALVEALGHPEGAFPSLLVAGTNGKGSVVAYADAVLRASGLRVGRYTSPHLRHVHERIVVGGEPISATALAEAVERVRTAADELIAAQRLPAHPTFFEVLTAAAFVHFQREAVQVAVLEVGMGGRLDATNVGQPLASAIVTISMDHEAFLGTSLAAIAGEKAGVLRAGRPTVLGPLPAVARRVVVEKARACGAVLVEAFDGVQCQVEAGNLDVQTPEALYRGLRPLPGAHQLDNAVVALRLLEEARRSGIPVDLAGAAPALSAARWPGRLQEIPARDGRPRMILDGAHNPAAAEALAASLAPRRPWVLLFGVMADKDVPAIARPLFPLAEALVLTRPNVGRAATPEEIVARCAPLADRAYREPEVGGALRRACRLAGPEGTVVVAGSLYLVGAVMAQLEDERWP